MENLTEFLDLGKQPIANGFLTKDQLKDNEYFYELKVGFNQETKLVSIINQVDPPLMFNDSYPYNTSMSTTMIKHFEDIATKIKNIKSNPKVLEIGSNSGEFIKHFDKSLSLAVEPCGNFAKVTENLGIKTYNRFWTHDLAKEIFQNHGKYDFIYAANCICHIPDLIDTFKGVKDLLNNEGIFIFEDPSLARVILNGSFCQWYDEHPHMFSIIAIKNLLKEAGLKLFGVETLNVHGGSNRILAIKDSEIVSESESVNRNIWFETEIMKLDQIQTYYDFADKVKKSKKDLVNILNIQKSKGKIISYGATAKSTTIFNYCNINSELIDFITDTTIDKQNKFSPGQHIPVVSPDINWDEVETIFLGAWNFKDFILNKEKEHFKNKTVITHVPYVRIV